MKDMQQDIRQILVNQGIQSEILKRVETDGKETKKQAYATNGNVIRLKERADNTDHEMDKINRRLDEMGITPNTKSSGVLSFTWEKVTMVLIAVIGSAMLFVIEKLN